MRRWRLPPSIASTTTPGRSRSRSQMLLGGCWRSASGGRCWRAEPAAVPTRPDPFAEAAAPSTPVASPAPGRRCPRASGCRSRPARRSPATRMLLTEPRTHGAGQPRTGPSSLVEPRHRLQLDATAQLGCVFGQLALQRQVDPAGDYWSWDGSAISWRIDEHWRVGAGRIATAMGSGLGRQPDPGHRRAALPQPARSRRPAARWRRTASGGGSAR